MGPLGGFRGRVLGVAGFHDLKIAGVEAVEAVGSQGGLAGSPGGIDRCLDRPRRILNPAVEPVEIARDARVYWASQLLRTSPNG